MMNPDVLNGKNIQSADEWLRKLREEACRVVVMVGVSADDTEGRTVLCMDESTPRAEAVKALRRSLYLLTGNEEYL